MMNECGRYELQTTFDRLTREIPSLGLSSGQYQIEGEIGWDLCGDRIEFDEISIVLRLLPEDPEDEEGYIWEWRSDVVHKDRIQNKRDYDRAVEILDTFQDADNIKFGVKPTIAEMIRSEIESEDPDVNFILRHDNC